MGEKNEYSQSDPLKTAWKTASPPPRRWGGIFRNDRFLPRRRKSWRPHFGHAKPHGQES